MVSPYTSSLSLKNISQVIGSVATTRTSFSDDTTSAKESDAIESMLKLTTHFVPVTTSSFQNQDNAVSVTGKEHNYSTRFPFKRNNCEIVSNPVVTKSECKGNITPERKELEEDIESMKKEAEVLLHFFRRNQSLSDNKSQEAVDQKANSCKRIKTES